MKVSANQQKLKKHFKAPTPEQFHEALTSDPRNERLIVNTLSKLSKQNLLKFRQDYAKKLGHPIQEDLTEYLSGKFKDLSIAMFDTQGEYDAKEMHRALHSFTNDNRVIAEIFATRSKKELELLSDAYEKFYGISLLNDLEKEVSKEQYPFLKAILENKRPEGKTLSKEAIDAELEEIKKNGLKSYGNEVELFKEIFLQKSREDLANIAREFKIKEGKDFYTALDDELSGKNKKLIKEITFGLISPSEYFSKNIYKSIRGFGTDTNSLNRNLLYRADTDIDVLAEFYRKFRNNTLAEDIEGDSSGPYGQVLLNLVEKRPSGDVNY